MLVLSNDWRSAIDAMLVVGISIYGGYCVSLLGKRRYEAPAHAQRWLLGLATIGVLRAVIGYATTGEPPPGSGLPVVFAVIWLTYLAKSKRVAGVYRAADKVRTLGGEPRERKPFSSRVQRHKSASGRYKSGVVQKRGKGWLTESSDNQGLCS
jgi:hypothetical protein